MDSFFGAGLANTPGVGDFGFCFRYVSAVLPIWRFALPMLCSYIVFLGCFSGGILVLPGFTPAYQSFEIGIGPLWPIMFVTIACGAISGWHSIVSSSGTARQLESELDARPVGAGVMFLEMMLALFALIRGHIYTSRRIPPPRRNACCRLRCRGIQILLVLGCANAWYSWQRDGIFLAVTIMQLVRFMVATRRFSDVKRSSQCPRGP
jgi:carbon starvation protein CstA